MFIVPLLVVAIVVPVALTAWALEWDGVAVVDTTRGDRSLRTTHLWWAEADGAIWLEAGEPENGWMADVRATSRLWIRTPTAAAGAYRTRALPNPDGHRRIRALMREKYGFRDWWIGLLFDTSRSVAIRLEPLSDAGRRN